MDQLKTDFISKLREQIAASPTSINVIFGFILTGLEKLLEKEFECPCNPSRNVLYSIALFTIPAIIVFVLMMIIQNCNCQCCCNCKCGWTCKIENKILSSFIPAIVWLELLFFDGEYYACAMATKSGTYVKPQAADRRRWCQPTAHLVEGEKEMIMHDAHTHYGNSQIICFVPLLVLCLGLILYAMKKHFSKETKDSCCRRVCCTEGTKNSVCCTEETKVSVSCGSRRVCFKNRTNDAKLRCKRERQEEEGEQDTHELTELNQPQQNVSIEMDTIS